ncbi:MAG: DUF4238 domain-containing protein [Rhodospirillales bacterium]|nr:DUF4238 domain-containing protein [Rhodospirillales bacterium]
MGLKILMDAIQNEKVSQEIFDMHWWVHDFKDSLVPLIASDRPLRISNGIGDRECVISIPLTPSKLFIAAPILEKKEAFIRMNQLELVVKHNKVIAACADRRVYGHTGMLFVQRYLGIGDKIPFMKRV